MYVLVAADPSGKFVYLVDEINAWGFDLDAVSGALTAMSRAPFPAGAEALDLTIVGDNSVARRFGAAGEHIAAVNGKRTAAIRDMGVSHQCSKPCQYVRMEIGRSLMSH